ncbi:hypothetical protein LCGC14_3163140, partial [marine sediment metagenome]
MYQEFGANTGRLFPLYVEGRENYLMRLSSMEGETLVFYVPRFWRGLEADQLALREPARQTVIR